MTDVILILILAFLVGILTGYMMKWR